MTYACTIRIGALVRKGEIAYLRGVCLQEGVAVQIREDRGLLGSDCYIRLDGDSDAIDRVVWRVNGRLRGLSVGQPSVRP